jgi:hypothetical protein
MHCWLEEVDPYVHSLTRAASAAASRIDPTDSDEEETKAIGEVRIAASALGQWVNANPCPDTQLGERFAVVAARFGFAILAQQRQMDSVSRSATLDRLRNMYGDLRELKHAMDPRTNTAP